MSLTFITSFYLLNSSDYNSENILKIRNILCELIDKKINICIYTCEELCGLFKLYEKSPNVKVYSNLKIDELFDMLHNTNLTKPNYCYLPKYTDKNIETYEYFKHNNLKMEFINHCVLNKPFNGSYYAWLDINFCNCVKNIDVFITNILELNNIFNGTFNNNELNIIETLKNKINNLLILCGNSKNTVTIDEIKNDFKHKKNNRFYTDFFIFNETGFKNIYDTYKKYQCDYVKLINESCDEYGYEYVNLLWDNNYFSWLETTNNSQINSTHNIFTDFEIKWIYSNYDEDIIKNITQYLLNFNVTINECTSNIKKEHTYFKLKDLGSIAYNYDVANVDGFTASSGSYIYFKGQHLLNTRYVNYCYYEDGEHYFKNGINYNISRNVVSSLEKYDTNNAVYMPKTFIEMNENIDLPKHELYARGIEDIRLFELNNELYFISTNVNYYHTSGNRIIIGKYHLHNFTLNDAFIVMPPTDTWSEKNWVPIINTNENQKMSDVFFIYKWYPLQIGKIVDANINSSIKKQLHITNIFEETKKNVLFEKVCGSTPFIINISENNKKTYIGLVHFKYHGKPPKYYHMLVFLDYNTLKPIKYSEPFCFENEGIEFCLSFNITENKYYFWTSSFDKNPSLVIIEKNKININNVFE